MPVSKPEPSQDGKSLIDVEATEPSLDELLKRVPPMSIKERRALIRHLRQEREEWTPSQ